MALIWGNFDLRRCLFSSNSLGWLVILSLIASNFFVVHAGRVTKGLEIVIYKKKGSELLISHPAITFTMGIPLLHSQENRCSMDRSQRRKEGRNIHLDCITHQQLYKLENFRAKRRKGRKLCSVDSRFEVGC